MKKYLSILGQNRLFAGVRESELSSLLGCLQATSRAYPKGSFVLRQGDRPASVMVLAEGQLHIRRDDYWGSRSLVSVVTPGEMFGEAYADPAGGPILNDVAAVEDSVVLFFDTGRLLTTCSSACRFHALVVQNLFFAICEKNRALVQKLGHMSRRTTRQKLMSYLSEESRRQGSASFSIPLNRQQLADFLAVDRSAMSAELSRLRDEGYLTFQKNRFTLLRGDF